MRNLKYFIILLLIISCSLPTKEDLYSKSNDLTINKDLDEYGIIVVKFDDAIWNVRGTVYKLGFGNVKICHVEGWKCYNLSMYDQFGKDFGNRLRLSISGEYFAFKLKPGRYYIRQIQTGLTNNDSYTFRFNNFNKSKYNINVIKSKVVYVGDWSINYNVVGLSASSHFTIKNNFKEAIEAIKKENPLLDVSNAEVDLFKGE